MAYLAQPHFTHSHGLHVQNSPLQLGHAQPSQAHESGNAAASFLAQQAPLVQQLGWASLFGALAAERQPQSSHPHGSHVQNSPLQSGHAQPSQAQPWPAAALESLELRALAVMVRAKPTKTIANEVATRMRQRFMVEILSG